MPLQISCPHCFQTLILPYTEAGLKVNCPNCHAPIALTAAQEEKKKSEGKRPAPSDLWFLKVEDGSDYGPVAKPVLDQWFAEGRISAECQLLHLGDEEWHWASDLFPELEDGEGEVAQGTPVNRYDISDLLPPVAAGPAVPPGMYGLPGAPAPLPTIGSTPFGQEPAEHVPRMRRRLNEATDPNLTGSSLYLETLDKIQHRQGGHHPLVVGTAVLNFIFGTYATLLGIGVFIVAVYNSPGASALVEGRWEFWAPLLPLALAGYGLFVLQTAIGLLNYQAWTIMATYVQSAISMTVSIIIILIPVWLAFPPLLIFAVSGIVYGILGTIAVSIPWVIADFD
jgi:hypothetical protein